MSIKIEINTENAKELHAELTQLLFGIGGVPQAPANVTAQHVPAQEPEAVEVKEEAEAPVAEVVEKPKRVRPSRAKPKEEAKVVEMVPEQEEATKEEAPKAEATKEEAPKAEAPKAEAPKEEAPKEETVSGAPKGEVTLEAVRKKIGELKTAGKEEQAKTLFKTFGVQNLNKLSAEQRADYLTKMEAL